MAKVLSYQKVEGKKLQPVHPPASKKKERNPMNCFAFCFLARLPNPLSHAPLPELRCALQAHGQLAGRSCGAQTVKNWVRNRTKEGKE